MPGKPNILTVAEFLNLKGVQKGPIVVYFNRDQWANLTRDLEPGRGKPPDKSLTVTLTELPGVDGGLAVFRCPIGCSGPLRGAEGQTHCDCDHKDPDPSGPELKVKFCAMLVRKDGSVACRGVCSTGTCRLASWNAPAIGGSRLVVLSCKCGT